MFFIRPAAWVPDARRECLDARLGGDLSERDDRLDRSASLMPLALQETDSAFHSVGGQRPSPIIYGYPASEDTRSWLSTGQAHEDISPSGGGQAPDQVALANAFPASSGAAARAIGISLPRWNAPLADGAGLSAFVAAEPAPAYELMVPPAVARDAGTAGPSPPLLHLGTGIAAAAPATARSGDALQAGSPATAQPTAHTEGSRNNTPSVTQTLNFSLKSALQLSPSNSFTIAVPSAFYQHVSKDFSYSYAGFSADAHASLYAGVKGSLKFNLGTILPDYPLALNPETVGYVQEGQVFTVSPTLISTSDASFKLGLPTAALTGSFGLKGSAGVSLDFPSVSVGVSVFGHTIGYSFGPPPVSAGISFGSIEKLPTSKTVNFTGGYVTVSELKPANYSTAGTTQAYGIPVLSATAYTDPALAAQFDPIAVIANYVPDLKVLAGSKDFGVGSVNWDLLSLPISASLELENRTTVTEKGLSAHLTESLNGKTTNLGTHSVTVGFDIGQQWTLTAPSLTPTHKGGVIDLKLAYQLTLQVNSTISLAGSFGLALDGPQGTVSLLGHDFGIGPIFSDTLFSTSGDLLDLESTTNLVTLTAVQNDLVFYGPIAMKQTLANSQHMSYALKAGGEQLVIPTGVYIAPSTSTAGSYYGVIGTLGAAAIYNYGSVYANRDAEKKSAAIQLLAGGKVVNTGNVNWDSGGGHLQGAPNYGIDIGGTNSTVVNSGTIGNVNLACIFAGNGGSDLSIYNTATGVIRDGEDGIRSYGASLELHNQGRIFDNITFGVNAGAGLLLFNAGGPTAAAQGYIESIQGTAVSGGSNSYVRNDGLIVGNTFYTKSVGVELSSGFVVNTGTIKGSVYGVDIGNGGAPQSAFVYNSGLIQADPSSAFHYAVKLGAQTNYLAIKPGASFIGNVAAVNSSAGQNTIQLLAGVSAGTLNMTKAQNYSGFNKINVSPSAAWLLETTTSNPFGGAAITGLNSLDRIGFAGLAFAYGDKALLNVAKGQITLEGANGSTLATVQLGGTVTAANLHVSGNANATYIREFTGNFTNVLHGTVAAQQISTNSYYGGNLTIAAGASVSNTVAGAPATSFGLQLQPIRNVSTTTSNGKPTTTTIVTPVTLSNSGSIAGGAQGVYLQSAGTIDNGGSGSIYAKTGDGIFQKATLAGAVISNYGTIVGQDSAINVGGGAMLTNYGVLAGGVAGILSGASSVIRNAGTIVGVDAKFTGVVLAAESTLVNGAYGLVSGGTYGVQSSAAGALVMNSGSIDGKIGIDLTAGGFVNNSYSTFQSGVGGTLHAVTRLGAIIPTAGAYAVEIAGGAGTVVNEVNALTSAPSLGVIAGISLQDGGTVINGRFGDILAAGRYAINLAPADMKAGATGSIANSGTIGAVLVAGGDSVDNAGTGSLLSVKAVSLSGSTGPVTILNQGVIGATTGTVTGIFSRIAAVIDNGFGATIEGSNASAIALLGGGTITDAGAINAAGAVSAINFGTAAGTLLLQTGASFEGLVTGNAASTLILGPGQASIGGIGVQITGFGQNMVDAGSLWVLKGQNILAGSWTVAGELVSGYPLTGMTYGLTAAGNVTVSGVLQGANAFPRMGETGQDGANGVAIATGGTVRNSGVIKGGWGGNGAYSGSGVVLEGGTLINTAQVAGGSFYYQSHSGPGGVGVALGTGSLINSGTIRGGTSMNADPRYGVGGNGVAIGAGGVAVNSGVIVGGNGSGYGGIGVLDGGGTFTNTGTIEGGSGTLGNGAGFYLQSGTLVDAGWIAGGGGRVAVSFGTGTATLALRAGATFIGAVTANEAGRDTLELSGATSATLTGLGSAFTGFPIITEDAGSQWTLTGSNTIAAGVTLTSTALSAANGTLRNDGIIAAQTVATSPTVNGYSGLGVQSGALLNNGTIRGGYGQASQSQPYGDGGDGVLALGGTLTNTGTIAGGGGPTVVTSGAGVSLSGSAHLINSGTILGGGDQRTSFYGGAGLVQTGGTSVNSGIIAGGAGYDADAVGVSLSGGTLTSSGLITGGSFGNDGSVGAVGVNIAGGDLVNTGTIVGGAGYNGVAVGVYFGGGTFMSSGTVAGGHFNGMQGDAITFGSAAATLTIQPQSVFVGRVVANSGAQDALLLAGRGGTLSGLGSEFLNFSVLDASTNTTWTLAGTQSFSGTLTGGGAITLTGTLSGAGALTIAAGTTLAATGTFAEAVDVLGAIAVQAGTVSAQAALSGTGTLTTVAGSRLTLAGGGNFAGAFSGAGTIAVTAGLSLAKGASLSAAMVLETANLKLGAGENLSNAAGKIFELAPAASTTASLSGSAGDIFTNAGQFLANGAGSGTIGLAFINAGTLVASTGTLVLAGKVTNSGTIEAASGLLSATQAISGAGVLEIGTGGSLSLGNSVAASQSVDFLAHAGMLDLGDPLGFKAAIAGFAGTSMIDLTGVAATSLQFANGTLTVDKGTTAIAALHFTGTYTSASFTLVSDGHGGSLIRFV